MSNILTKTTTLLICLLVTINITNAQTVTIGGGTATNGSPYNPYYGYTYSQSIFDQSEIAITADLDKIRYYFNGNSAFTDNPVNVYVGHTTKSTFSSTSDWIAVGALTLVYSGPVTTTTTAGWVEIDISDFSYNNTDNLIIAVHETQSGYHSSSDDFYATACTGNKTLLKYRDSPVIDPTSPPTGALYSSRPNVQLVFVNATPMTYTSSTVTQFNTNDVLQGNTNREIIGIEVVTAGGASPFDLTQFQINMNGSTNGTVDVSNIDIYSTGLSSTFATTTLFGSATPTGGAINVNGSKTLSSGTNYFWLVYDIAGGATIGNFVDAECTQITMNGGIGNKTPSTTAPAGEREIVLVPPVYTMDNTSVNTCYGVFYDSGNTGSNYSDNEIYTKTFCSDNGENLRFDFTSFDIQNTWDRLRIYDGPNTSSTLIGTYTTSVPINIISTGTCLTFEFESNCCTNKSGWEANISCFDPGTCGVNPDATDLCTNAPLLTGLDGICGTTGTYTATDLSGTNLQAETCAGLNFINGNSWLQFQADATTVELAILCNCPGSGIEVSVFETADCNTFTEMGCYAPFYNQAPGVFTVSGLTIGNNYYIMIDQFGAAGCGFQVNGLSGIALPITLTNIEATCNNGFVQIDWTTSTEINNDHFDVERSDDGKNFEIVGTINGAGNSNTNLNYSFIDDSPTSDFGYYRLKQTDFDGKFSYSKIVVNKCIDQENYSAIYPNPAKNNLTIICSNLNSKVELIIRTALGNIVLKDVFKVDSGLHKNIDISRLSAGVYHIELISQSFKEVHKLIISK